MVPVTTALLLAASGASAATDTIVPPHQTEGAVTYMSGGIGRAQQSAMKRVASGYSLELDFLPNGKRHDTPPAYVPVTIKDQAGRVVFDRPSDGPLMLLKLPGGRYRIAAQNGTETQTRSVEIDPRACKVVAFDWNEQENASQADTPLADSAPH